MANQPKALVEEQRNPPGVTDNGPAPEQEHEEEVAQPEQEAEPEAAPEEGEPPAEEAPVKEPEAGEFEPDPQFAAKFKDDNGRIDWKKAHDAYLNLEKKLGSTPKIQPAQDDAAMLRTQVQQVEYLVQKYPDLPLRQAYQREMQEQARLRQSQQRESVPAVEVEELQDDEVERRVEELISQGKSAKAQILAARYTPEARLVRARERESQVERQRREQEAVEKAKQSTQAQLAEITAREGEIQQDVLDEMQAALAKTPTNIEVDMEVLYAVAKKRVAAKPKAKHAAQPPGRQPARGSAAPMRGNPKPGTDEEFLKSKRELTFEEVLEAQKKKK